MKNFRMNGKGAEELLTSPQVKRELERRARKVANAANGRAPVGATGNLSRSHKVRTDTTPGSKGATPRARAQVYSEMDYAITVEANTGYFSSALDEGAD